MCSRSALLLYLAMGWSAVASPSLAEPLALHELTASSPLSAYLELATERSSAIDSSRRELAAAEEVLASARAWPDPTLRYGFLPREVETALGGQRHRIGLSQQIPAFGKVALRSAIARADVERARQRLIAAHHTTLRVATEAVLEYGYLARAIDVTSDNLALLRALEATARARYRTGQARQVDVVKLQLELAQLESDQRSLLERRTPLASALRAGLGLPDDTPLPWPIPLLPPRAEPGSRDATIARLRARNPELATLRFEARAARRRAELARAERIPDVTLGLENIRIARSKLTRFADRGQDAWVMSLAVPLPVSPSKTRATIDASRARAAAARARARDVETALVARTDEMLYRMRDARRRIELYDTTLLPMAETTLDAAVTGFRTGTDRLLDVLDAQRTLLRFQLDLARARIDAGTATATILALTATTPGGVDPIEETIK